MAHQPPHTTFFPRPFRLGLTAPHPVALRFYSDPVEPIAPLACDKGQGFSMQELGGMVCKEWRRSSRWVASEPEYILSRRGPHQRRTQSVHRFTCE